MSLVTMAPAARARVATCIAACWSTSSTWTTRAEGRSAGGNFVRLQRGGVVAAPEHHALAGALVDENDRELIRPVMHESILHVDAARDQRLLHSACRCHPIR